MTNSVLQWTVVFATIISVGESSLGDQQKPADLTIPSGSDLAMVLSHDARRLMCATRSVVQVWNTQTLQPVAPPIRANAEQPFVCTAMSPDATKIAVASAVDIRLIDVATGREHSSLKQRGTVSVDFSLSGDQLLTRSATEINVWTIDDLVKLKRWPMDRRVYTLLWGGDDLIVAVLQNAEHDLSYRKSSDHAKPHTNGKAHLWRVSSGKLLRKPLEVSRVYDHVMNDPRSGLEPWVRPVAVSSDGKRLATFVLPDGLQIRRLPDGQVESQVPAAGRTDEVHTGACSWLTFSPDGSKIVVCGPASELSVLDAATGERLYRKEQSIVSADFSRDGRYLLTVSYDGVQLTSLRDRKVVFNLDFENADINANLPSAAFDGSRVYVSMTGKHVTRVYGVPPQ